MAPPDESVNPAGTGLAQSVCPYCGCTQPASEQCQSCGGLFEPLSRQATQNAMGAWFIRDEEQPFRPGCSLQTLQRLIARGRLTGDTVIRGPTTRQFWSFARDAPGVAHLLGVCHNCHGPASLDEYMCRVCGAVFIAPTDRQLLGLAPVRLLPGEAPPEVIAAPATATAIPDAPTRPLVQSAPTAAAATDRPPEIGATSGIHAAQSSSPLSKQGSAALRDHTAAAPQIETDREAIDSLRREVRRLRTATFALGAFATALAVSLLVILTGFLAGDTDRVKGHADARDFSVTALPAAPGPGNPPLPLPPSALADPGAQWREARDRAMRTAESSAPEALESALRQLEAIRREAPQEWRPPTLDADITDVSHRLQIASLRKLL